MARTFMDDRRPMKGTERASKESLEKKGEVNEQWRLKNSQRQQSREKTL